MDGFSSHDAPLARADDDQEAGRGFRVPEPAARPGQAPDFSSVDVGEAGDLSLPPIDAPHTAFQDHARGLLRVLDDDSNARGAWARFCQPDDLLRGYRAMIRTRAFDERMVRAQRQGKTSFYVQCLGEEAIAVGAAVATENTDMHFPTYRQQGILFARDINPIRMINQIYSNEHDELGGHQLPVLYSFKDAGFFTISGNLATQWPQAVGWAMGSALRNDQHVAVGWIGDGATAEGDWHQGNLFASVYRAPVLLCVVNNQWAISTPNSFAGADKATFAERMATYGLPALRVDGNDYLAVLAACRFAVERAREGYGATGIEFVTFRQGAHSTSDDPGKYRPKDMSALWPLGDPVARLRQHLLCTDLLTAEQMDTIAAEAEEEMRQAEQQAASHGILSEGRGASSDKMFYQVYNDMPNWLKEQQQEAALTEDRFDR
ncbi:MAG: thiamine pyrophosphate-dependent enzyme [Pseudomonadota bacterium]